MVAGTVRYSTMIPVPVATLYPLKYRRRYFWELELDPGAGAVDTAFYVWQQLYWYCVYSFVLQSTDPATLTWLNHQQDITLELQPVIATDLVSPASRFFFFFGKGWGKKRLAGEATTDQTNFVAKLT